MSKSERYLAWYSGALTLVFAAVVLTGASAARSAKFDRIDAQRIDIREADGTLRMVISNRGSFPGLIYKAKEYPHDRGSAGVIFYNDEGTENGGLIFDGAKGADGRISSGGHLSFDQYEQDQVLSLTQEESGGVRRAGLSIGDRPDASLEPVAAAIDEIRKLPEAEQARKIAELQGGQSPAQRLFVGKNRERESLVELKDAQGKPRLRLTVAPGGEARIEFLDAAGKVQRTLGPEVAASRH